MGSLVDELVKKGHVTAEHAMRVERDHGVDEVFNEGERKTQRQKKLRRELKKLLQSEDDRGVIADIIEKLSEEYRDVFDQVVTEFSFDVQLGR